MKRTALERKTPLKAGQRSLERHSTFAAPRQPLNPVSPRRSDVEKVRTSGSTLSRSGFTPASPAQKAKVKEEGCRLTGEFGEHVHPAHVIDRALGGCDDALCVIGLRADHHRLYDENKLDILGLLNPEEEAHAVMHVGILQAARQITGVRHVGEDLIRVVVVS